LPSRDLGIGFLFALDTLGDQQEQNPKTKQKTIKQRSNKKVN